MKNKKISWNAVCFNLPVHYNLFNRVYYNMILDITGFKDGPQKCIDYIEKWP